MEDCLEVFEQVAILNALFEYFHFKLILCILQEYNTLHGLIMVRT